MVECLVAKIAALCTALETERDGIDVERDGIEVAHASENRIEQAPLNLKSRGGNAARTKP